MGAKAVHDLSVLLTLVGPVDECLAHAYAEDWAVSLGGDNRVSGCVAEVDGRMLIGTGEQMADR
jgi:hypothetical protein